MKKILTSILVTFFLFVISTNVLSREEWKPKEWKGEGTRIEFPSMPTLTIKDFLQGKIPERRITIWGTLNFPANAPDKNVPAVVIMHGGSGIDAVEEHWMNVFNGMGLATFMVDSNWARRKCKKQLKQTIKLKKSIPYCNEVHRGITRIIDGYGALELLSKHPRIDPKRIGCLGISLGARGCLYINVKRFQKMWGTPGLEFAASVPMYPPCNVIFKEDDEITNTPIRIHVGDLDTYFPYESCVNYVERLSAKGKDVKIKVYSDAHHGFEAKIGGKKSMKIKGHNDGRCYYEENTEVPKELVEEGDVAVITQIGFNEWLTSATEKEKKKVFKRVKMRHKFGWRLPQIQFDKSCISKSNTMAYNKDAAEDATRLVKDFFTTTLKF